MHGGGAEVDMGRNYLPRVRLGALGCTCRWADLNQQGQIFEDLWDSWGPMYAF